MSIVPMYVCGLRFSMHNKNLIYFIFQTQLLTVSVLTIPSLFEFVINNSGFVCVAGFVYLLRVL